MSFQAYIDNIKAKTGKTPEDFRKLAEKEGLLNQRRRDFLLADRGNNRGTSQSQNPPKSSSTVPNTRSCNISIFSNICSFQTACRSSVGGPEKAGVGGSIPSLATILT
jgi:Domain of unknown function (DUF4287)